MKKAALKQMDNKKYASKLRGKSKIYITAVITIGHSNVLIKNEEDKIKWFI
jgi:hypothetical protein